MELADNSVPSGTEFRLQPAERSPASTASKTLSPEPAKAGTTYFPRTLASEVKPRGALPLDECIRIAASLSEALAELHRHDLVHRDIKPSNIIFVNGAPKLADISLVASATDSRSFVGTEGFIPPEGPGSVQADLYSLGIVLYVLATGKHHRDFPEPPAELSTLPSTNRAQLLELIAVIHRACQSNPKDRCQSAETLLADLELFQSGHSVKRRHSLHRAFSFASKFALICAFTAIAEKAIAARAPGGYTGLALARLGLELEPSRPIHHLLRGYLLWSGDNRPAGARDLLRTVELNGFAGLDPITDGPPLRSTLAERGPEQFLTELIALLEKRLAEGHFVFLYELARLHALVPHRAETLDYLERAVEAKGGIVLSVCIMPQCRQFDEDPRFKAILLKLWLNAL